MVNNYIERVGNYLIYKVKNQFGLLYSFAFTTCILYLQQQMQVILPLFLTFFAIKV